MLETKTLKEISMEVSVNEFMDRIKYGHGNRHSIVTNPVFVFFNIYNQGLLCLSENIDKTLFPGMSFQYTFNISLLYHRNYICGK
jgi:hypothetical protein